MNNVLSIWLFSFMLAYFVIIVIRLVVPIDYLESFFSGNAVIFALVSAILIVLILEAAQKIKKVIK